MYLQPTNQFPVYTHAASFICWRALLRKASGTGAGRHGMFPSKGTASIAGRRCTRAACTFQPLGSCPHAVSNYPIPTSIIFDGTGRPGVVHIPLTANLLLNALLTTMWGLTVTAVAMGKIVIEYGTDGYVKYMTNWTWTAQMVYYDAMAILTWVSIVKEIHARYTHSCPSNDFGLRVLYEFFYIVMLMLVTGVNFGVVAVLYFQPALISENAVVYGLSDTLSGNYFIHVVPQIIVLAHTLFARSILCQVFSREPLALLWIITRSLLGCLVFGVLYFSMFSPTVVYELPDISVTIMTAGVFCAFAITAVVIVVISLSSYGEISLSHPIQRAKRRGADDGGCY